MEMKMNMKLMGLSLKAMDLFREEGIELDWDKIETKYNARFKAVFGRCKRLNGGEKFVVEINKYFLDNGEDIEILDTLVHEYIHTIDGCFNHGEKFKLVGRMFDKHGLSISRTSAKGEIRAERKSINYVIQCDECKKQWHRNRAKKELSKFQCPCGGDLTQYKV